MGKYTIYSGKKGRDADKLIDSYTKIIIEEIKKNVEENNLLSVILIGGFARGEGSVIFEKNKISPLNDFDIFIITKKPLKNDLKKLSIECLKKCKIESKFSFKESLGIMQFYIDFRNMTLDELKKVPSFIKYYEIKNSAKIIYGENVLKYIPDYSLADIPLEEGLRHMFNRLSLLLEYLVPSYENIDDEKKKTAMFFLGKCYLSIAEAFLLYSQDFVCSYEKRAEIFRKNFVQKFPELYTLIPDLDKKIEISTNFKLKPELIHEDYEKLWFETRDDTIKAIICYFNLIYKQKIKSSSLGLLSISKKLGKLLHKRFLIKYLHIYLKQRNMSIKNSFFLSIINYPAQFYLSLLFFRALKQNNNQNNFFGLFSLTDPGIRFYSSLFLCILSINRAHQIDNKLFFAAYKNLKKIFHLKKFNNKPSFNDWKNLCNNYTNAFRIYQFLKI